MAKRPVPGETKTRLCPPLTPVEAAELYEALLRDTLELVSGLRGVETAVAVSPRSAVDEMRRMAPRGAGMLAVEGADIGECLRSATEQLFAKRIHAGRRRQLRWPNVARGIPRASRRDAREQRCRPRPAEDGGYYLIGMRQKQPGLFTDIAWSSPGVAAQTLERAAAAGLTVAQLPAWYDVDTPAELERLRKELAARPPGIAPYTALFSAATDPATPVGWRSRSVPWRLFLAIGCRRQ